MKNDKRTLTFPEVKAPKWRASERNGLHGLWHSLLNAYNSHKTIIISPDDVYNTICCIWAKYILLNAEKFRSQIVNHTGQKELLYMTNDHSLNDENMEEHMNAFIRLIEKDENKSISWMNAKFSTTTTLDSFIRKTAVLASQKKYYKYSSMLLCGLPEIILLGTKEDWTLLRQTISNMTTYDINMVEWVGKLDTVLEKFEAGDETDSAFWQAPFTVNGGGSGSPTYYRGWATVFNPFAEDNTWNTRNAGSYYSVKETDILNLTVDFTINLIDESGQNYADWLIKASLESENVDDSFGVKKVFRYTVKENKDARGA